MATYLMQTRFDVGTESSCEELIVHLSLSSDHDHLAGLWYSNADTSILWTFMCNLGLLAFEYMSERSLLWFTDG